MKDKKPRGLSPLVGALVGVLAGAFNPCMVHAQDSGDSAFKFSGFGTVGIGVSDNSDSRYVNAGHLRGFTKKVSGEVDTRLGLQGTFKLDRTFSATAQLLTRQDRKGSWTPAVEWAFVKAQLTPQWSVRAGRMGTPYYAVSDFRDVGYANTWIRPPIDVYGQVPFRTHEGIDTSYQLSFDGGTVTTQALAGRSIDRARGIRGDLTPIWGLNSIIELDNGLTLRVGHVQGDFTVDSARLTPLVAFIRSVGALELADQLEFKDDKGAFTGIGLAYDQNDWIVNMEYTKRHGETLISDTTSWFATLGYRFGPVAPYITVSQAKVQSYNITAQIPPPLAPTFAGLFAGQNIAQKTLALGVRWDAYRNIAVKAQIDRVSPDRFGLFEPNPNIANPVPGQKINVFSVAVDFVF